MIYFQLLFIYLFLMLYNLVEFFLFLFSFCLNLIKIKDIIAYL